jgi:hypothetical protein
MRRADRQRKAPALWENRGLDGEIAGSWGLKDHSPPGYPTCACELRFPVLTVDRRDQISTVRPKEKAPAIDDVTVVHYPPSIDSRQAIRLKYRRSEWSGCI